MMNKEAIFQITTDAAFKQLSLHIFHEQARTCRVYADYLSALNFDTSQVKELTDIPFLPIEFFKSHSVIKTGEQAQIIFSSSGTTEIGRASCRESVDFTGVAGNATT